MKHLLLIFIFVLEMAMFVGQPAVGQAEVVAVPKTVEPKKLAGVKPRNVVFILSDDHRFDAISGATATVRIIDDSIIRSAIKVARLHGLGGMKSKTRGPSAKIDTSFSELKDWPRVPICSFVGQNQSGVTVLPCFRCTQLTSPCCSETYT